MNIKFPFINYIKTLVASRRSCDVVREELVAMGLLVDKKTLLNIKDQLYLEQPDYFDDYNEPVDIDWLEKHNIDKMYGFLYEKQVRRPIEGAEGALRIFDDNQLYRLITSMSLADIDVEEIELLIQGRIDINYTIDDIREFLNYFFNTDGWSKKEKEMHVATVKDTDLKRAYKDALSGDKNKLLWKLKLSPSLDYDEMLREISYDTFYKFKQLVEVDPDLSLKFASMFEKVAARLEKVTEERREDVAASEGMSFIFEEDDREEIKTINDLKKGEGDV